MILLNYMTPWQKTQRIVPPCIIIIIFFNANIHTTQHNRETSVAIMLIEGVHVIGLSFHVVE